MRGGGDPVPDLRGARTACDGARRRDRQAADCRHRARRELLSRGPPHSRRRGHQQVLRYPELGARGELQHHQRRAPRQQGRVRRETDAAHSACDQPVSGAGAERPRPHQPEPGARGGPAIRRRAARCLYQAGRRQRRRQDRSRIVPTGLAPVYVHRQSRPLSEILRELLTAQTTTLPTRSSSRSARKASAVR